MNNLSFKEILSPQLPMMTIVDVGAMVECKNRFDVLVERGMARVIGFEPDPIEFQKLKTREDEQHVFLPYFVGNGQPATFHRCRYNGCSSLYQPNHDVVELFASLGDPANGFFEVLTTSEAATVRLDDLKEVGACDLLKIDVQGAELDVLDGSIRTLQKTSVVEVEVGFVPLYQRQPLFAEIDLFMRKNGFVLHKLATVGSRAVLPFMVDNDPRKPVSQWLWGDAVYIRDFTRFHKVAPEILLNTAIVLHEVYCAVDMALHALKSYDVKVGTKLSEEYMARVSRAGRVEYGLINFV